MYCRYCGKEIADNATYCPHCWDENKYRYYVDTKVTEEDIADGVEDEYGVVYSRDGKRLLTCNGYQQMFYIVKNGTKVICDGAFSHWSELKRISLPMELQEIGYEAFGSYWNLCYYHSLKRVYIRVTDGADAGAVLKRFNYIKGRVPGLENIIAIIIDKYGVYYSADGKKIWDCRNKNLTEYTVKEGTEEICDSAFDRCESLTSIVLPEGLTTIGEWAFVECKSLTSINFPEGLTRIERLAFWRCKSLTSVVLPNSVKTIESGAFNECESLTSIKLPLGIYTYRSIFANIFAYCPSLKKMYIRCSAEADVTSVVEEFKNYKIEVVKEVITYK